MVAVHSKLGLRDQSQVANCDFEIGYVSSGIKRGLAGTLFVTGTERRISVAVLEKMLCV